MNGGAAENANTNVFEQLFRVETLQNGVFLVLHTPPPHRAQNTKRNHNKQMDVHFEDFKANQHTVEVGADDTAEDMRRKVASAVGLPEDSFCMSFGDEAMVEGYDMMQLSAGDTIVLTKSMKYEAVKALHALGETDLTIKRLRKVDDPEVACLLLQAEVATVIPNDFLATRSFTRLDLSAVSTVTRIGNFFLHSCNSLTTIDLSSLTSLTHIGGQFLAGCSTLKGLDLSSLRNVTHIGMQFLYNCSSLTALDASFNRLTQVGDNFLDGCSSLTQVDLSSLTSLTHMGGAFLVGCSALTQLDLSSLTSLTHMGGAFLSGCTCLTDVDLSAFNNLTRIGNYFLNGCYGLTAVELSSLHNVTHIGSGFLNKCHALTELDLSSLSSVTELGQNDLIGEQCYLKSIYLSGCSDVVSRTVKKSRRLTKFVVEARPKRKRDESPDEDCKRPRLSQ